MVYCSVRKLTSIIQAVVPTPTQVTSTLHFVNQFLNTYILSFQSTTNAIKIHTKCQHLLSINLAYYSTDFTTYVD